MSCNNARVSTHHGIRLAITAAISAATIAVVTACSAPQAVAWNPPLTHTPGHAPAVVFEDYLPSWVPVQAALKSWGLTPTFSLCAAYPQSTCVRLTTGNTSQSNELGETVRTLNTVNGKVTSVRSVTITINPALAGYSYSSRLETITHEIGHTYGLWHDNTGGAMNATVTGYYPAPSAAELTLLHQLYTK